MLKKGSAAAKAFMSKLRAAKGKKKTSGKKMSGPHDATIKALEEKKKFYEWNLNEFKKYLITAEKNKKTAEAKKIKSEIERLEKTIEQKNKDIETLKNPLPAAKKPAAKKKPLKTGFSNKKYDKRHQAMRPGKRISKEGNKYTENRENRSDKGKLFGIEDIPKKTLEKIKENLELIESLKNRQIPLMKQEAKILKGTEKTKKLYNIKYAIDFMATLKKQNTMLKKHI